MDKPSSLDPQKRDADESSQIDQKAALDEAFRRYVAADESIQVDQKIIDAAHAELLAIGFTEEQIAAYMSGGESLKVAMPEAEG